MACLNKKLLSIPMCQLPATGEEICATNARHHTKEYLKDRPHNFGYKYFVLCCDKGYAHKNLQWAEE